MPKRKTATESNTAVADEATDFPPKEESHEQNGEQPEKKPFEPYRPFAHSNDKKFEYGEDRRFKQMVFYFQDKPEPEVIDKLKQHGYKWHGDDKSWRTQANAVTRVEAGRLFNEIHSQDQGMSR